MITNEQRELFGEILEDLGSALDITESQHDAVVKSYQAVGTWLANEKSPLAIYEPEILPQGSFLFDTVIKPVDEKDDIDIDLVCRLVGKQKDWTQYGLKKVVGDRIKANGMYEKILEKEGRRCWTLKYSDKSNFHMDILPSIVSKDYKVILEKSLRAHAYENIDELAIRITDKERENYYSEINPDEWPKSNPFGYAKWFQNQANLELRKSALLLERNIEPVPSYNANKLPLKRVVQILKRHRDILFKGRENKPISIIITTLAAMAYQKEENLTEALFNVVNSIGDHLIEDRYDEKFGKVIKWIPNPVNAEENFADRWPNEPERQDNFYEWINKVKVDLNNAISQSGGLQKISAALDSPFGKSIVTEAFTKYGERQNLLRESGKQMMATATGMLGAAGKQVKGHNFYGTKE